MIKILAKNHSTSVQYLVDKIEAQGEACDLMISSTSKSVSEYLSNCINDGDKALFVIGNVGDSGTTVAETFGLGLFYDKFADQNLAEYCKLAQMQMPNQYVRDKLCVLPESFNHLNPTYGYQSAAVGTINQTQVYLLPDEYREVEAVYTNYVLKGLFKRPDGEGKYVFKVFGLSKEDVDARLSEVNPFVFRKSETNCLDTRITLGFPAKTGRQVISETLDKVQSLFAEYIYSTEDKSISLVVVQLLKSLGKKISTAESMTGGLIASNIIDNPGASEVLYEGIVCYSIASKCARLGISPHYVDEYGVVSAEVAHAMSAGLLKNGSDVAVSVTGYAGPSASTDCSSGLCFISVASTKTGVAVYKNVFSGDRNSVRQQAANMALFLVYKTFVK